MMTLHWSPKSPFVRKVMIVLAETGLTDSVRLVRTPVAMSRVNLDLLADNPLSKLPTLVLDDGTPIFDSRVIVEYLSTYAESQIVPTHDPARLLALRRQALGDGMLDMLLLFRQERNKPAERQTPEWLTGFQVKLDATLAHLETEAPKLDAAPFDIGVIAIGCAVSYLDFRSPEIDWRATHPQLRDWLARFDAHPSVARYAPQDDQPA